MPEKTPKIGDMVMYRCEPFSDPNEIQNNNPEVLPAIVVAVHNEGLVNLKVFCDGWHDAHRTSVPFHKVVKGCWFWKEEDDGRE